MQDPTWGEEFQAALTLLNEVGVGVDFVDDIAAMGAP
jgi:hypothetical protein